MNRIKAIKAVEKARRKYTSLVSVRTLKDIHSKVEPLKTMLRLEDNLVEAINNLKNIKGKIKMKFLIHLEYTDTDVKPCKEAYPTITEELRNGIKEKVVKWEIELNTMKELNKLVDDLKKPITLYKDNLLVIGD